MAVRPPASHSRLSAPNPRTPPPHSPKATRAYLTALTGRLSDGHQPRLAVEPRRSGLPLRSGRRRRRLMFWLMRSRELGLYQLAIAHSRSL